MCEDYKWLCERGLCGETERAREDGYCP
jgi:hypothetical protein